MASPAEAITQYGGAEPAASAPVEISVSVITPIVFCASLVPWARETSEAEMV
jgi:hypothetical protein